MAQAHAFATGNACASQHGSDLVVQYPLEASYRFCTTPISGGVCEAVVSSLLRELKGYGWVPSEEASDALVGLVNCMVSMADGTAEPKFFLSSLDPGLGKTTALIQFVQKLLRSDEHKEVAALLCFSRLEEIARVVKEMKLDEADYAVFTGKDDAVNKMTQTPRGNARVLFTTHSMVMHLCRGFCFEDLEVFHYQGQPRTVRVWDEGMVPGKVISFDTDKLASLREPLRQSCPTLAEEIDTLEVDLKAASDRGFFKWPDVEVASGTTFREAKRYLLRDGLIDHLERLYELSGCCVRLNKSGRGSTVTTAFDSRDVIPDDLAPIVILDASGRVRETYRFWEKHKGNLERLPSATKRYPNLAIKVMDRGSGKTAWTEHGDELAQEIACLIDSKPDEKWLVIYIKGVNGGRTPDQIRGLMDTDPARVSFLNWGKHQGTNDYKDIGNVILAGMNNYAEADYEMMARYYCNIGNDQPVPKALIEKMRKGEHMDHILQALCRSSVRLGQGSDCGLCNAFLIAPKQFNIRKLLLGVFPGCTVGTWRQAKGKLTGWVADAVAQIEAFFTSNPNGVFHYKDLRGALGITDASNFNRRVRKHESYKAKLEAMEVEEIAIGRGPHRTALAKKPLSFGPVKGGSYVAVK